MKVWHKILLSINIICQMEFYGYWSLLEWVQFWSSAPWPKICNFFLFFIFGLVSKYFPILLLIWNRHGHECWRISKLSGNFTLIQCIKIVEIFWGRLFFRVESSLIQSSCRSFFRVIVPYEISKVNFRVETKIIVNMSEEI